MNDGLRQRSGMTPEGEVKVVSAEDTHLFNSTTMFWVAGFCVAIAIYVLVTNAREAAVGAAFLLIIAAALIAVGVRRRRVR